MRCELRSWEAGRRWGDGGELHFLTIGLADVALVGHGGGGGGGGMQREGSDGEKGRESEEKEVLKPMVVEWRYTETYFQPPTSIISTNQGPRV